LIDPALYFANKLPVYSVNIPRCKSRKLFKDIEHLNIIAGILCYGFSLPFLIPGFIYSKIWSIIIASIFLYISSMNISLYFLNGNEVYNDAYRILIYLKNDVTRVLLFYFLAFLIVPLAIFPLIFFGGIFLVIYFIGVNAGNYIFIYVLLSLILAVWVSVIISYIVKVINENNEVLKRNPSAALLIFPLILSIAAFIILVPLIDLVIFFIITLEIDKPKEVEELSEFNEIRISSLIFIE
jgi:hypothetical protein